MAAMRILILLPAVWLATAAWADGMVGVPDSSERAGKAPSASSARRSIVIDGGGGPQRALPDYAAFLERERAEAAARQRIREQEMAAALAYTRGAPDQAAREAREAAQAEARKRQHDLEMNAAGSSALSCYFYDPETGCRGAPTGK
jgi:hypothetical protein